jgi:hypothetical protein
MSCLFTRKLGQISRLREEGLNPKELVEVDLVEIIG